MDEPSRFSDGQPLAPQPGAAEAIHDIEPPPPSSQARAHEFAAAGRNAIKFAISLTITWTVGFFMRFPVVRMLGAERFGQLTFADNFSAAFFSVLDLGISTYIFREIPVRPAHASEFWGGLLLVRLATSLILFVAMGATLAGSHHPFEIQATVFVFGLAQFASTYSTTINSLLNARSLVDRVAIANVASKLVWGAGLVGALLFTKSLPALALAMLASEVMRLIVIYPEARQALGLRFKVDMAATKAVLIASLPFFVSGGAVNIGGRLNVAVLEFVVKDHRELGWFGASQSLAALTLLLSPLLSWVLMPLLARAKTRSEEEVFAILRRTIEGLLVTVTPLTLIASLGADFWVRLAFGHEFDQSALSLRFLAYGFILIYLAIALSTLLIMTGHSWSVSMISLGSVPLRPILVILLAMPCTRRFGEGGGALGAALAEILTSIAIVAAHFIPIGSRALDRRVVMAGSKSLAVAAIVTVLDRAFLVRFGPIRLVVDGLVYVGLALAIGAVHLSEIVATVRMLLARRAARRAGGEGAA